MNKHTIFSICFVVFVNYFSFSKSEAPMVKTPSGIARGTYKKSYEGRTFSAFEGIPYAKPPVGELRFKEPQPADPWSDILIANKTYVCIQYTYLVFKKDATGDEDCLYMYVYVPREEINEEEKLDVVVHIHGGGFFVGDPKSMAGPDYIMDRDLIYISFNYRLGILGFLSTEDEILPGNNGLKDQTLALKWIRENIRYFGGNPESITLTGMSAGATCVHLHYLSPLSKGLFHRGHSQSGTALHPWALKTKPLKNAQKLGEIFNCNTNTSKELVDCFKAIPARNLTAATSNFFAYNGVLPPDSFSPVIEPNNKNAFLTEHPYKLLMEGRFNNIPWVSSSAKDEGIVPIGYFIMFHKLSELDRQWNEISPYTLLYYDSAEEKDKVFIAERVKEFYLRNESLSMENVFDLIKLHTDRLFHAATQTALRLQTKMGKSPVYFYFFDYHIQIPVIFKAGLPVVAHGDDYILLYYNSRNPKVLQDDDNEMRKVFLDFLFNFATTGVPRIRDVDWKPISTGEEINYIQISSANDIHVAHSKDIGMTSFWNSLPLQENARLFNTSPP